MRYVLIGLLAISLYTVYLAQEDRESDTVSPQPVTTHSGNFGRVIVGADEIGLRYDAEGRISGTLSTGYHVFFAPYEVAMFSLATLTYTAATIEGRSVDGQELRIDVSVDYRLLAQAVDEVGVNYVDNLLRPSLRQAVREVLSGYLAEDLYITTLDAQAEVRVALDAQLSGLISIEALTIDDIRFSQMFTDALNARETAQFMVTDAVATAESIRLTAEAAAESRIQGAELTATAEAEATITPTPSN